MFFICGKNRRTSTESVDIIEKYVIPVFNTLNSRDAILKHRRDYVNFDELNNHLILLEEAMIFGRRGDLAEVTHLFNNYYQHILAQYNHKLEHGTQTYLKKGQKLLYHSVRTDKLETIVATKSGYVTTYDANNSHLKYLENLAQSLGITIL